MGHDEDILGLRSGHKVVPHVENVLLGGCIVLQDTQKTSGNVRSMTKEEDGSRANPKHENVALKEKKKNRKCKTLKIDIRENKASIELSNGTKPAPQGLQTRGMKRNETRGRNTAVARGDFYKAPTIRLINKSCILQMP